MTLSQKDSDHFAVDLNMAGKACDRIAEKIGLHKIKRPDAYYSGASPADFYAFLNCVACGDCFVIHAHPTPDELNRIMSPCAKRGEK